MACHNLTVILMTGSFISGLALAIGHHFFYDYLNDRIVENQNQQEWFLRIGTGMAFLVRALLSTAVGISYTQMLWWTLRSKSITIEGINSLFGVTHTAWDFTTLELWTTAPALAIAAVIAWSDIISTGYIWYLSANVDIQGSTTDCRYHTRYTKHRDLL